MTPGRYGLSVYKGDSARWLFTLWADGGRLIPTDLSTVTVTAQIRTRPAGSLVLQLAPVVTLPNSIAIALEPADTAALPTTAAWDLQLAYASGDVQTVLSGPVNATTDVTRAGP